jgi:hypothetical protein
VLRHRGIELNEIRDGQITGKEPGRAKDSKRLPLAATEAPCTQRCEAGDAEKR